jgi:hypothetical protein
MTFKEVNSFLINILKESKMKLRELLNTSYLNESKERNLLGIDIYSPDGKIRTTIDETHQSKIWKGNFSCSYSNLDSLKYCPNEVNGDFACIENHLTTLEHGPSIVHGDYECHDNQLTSLKGSPKISYGHFDCSNNRLKSLEGCPETINGYFSVDNNKLTSLKDIHKHLHTVKGIIYAELNRITSHILGVLLIEGCEELRLDNVEVTDIIDKYLPNYEGRKGLMKCKAELVDAGFGAFAQL